jgi:hypothetical protein
MPRRMRVRVDDSGQRTAIHTLCAALVCDASLGSADHLLLARGWLLVLFLLSLLFFWLSVPAS